VAYKPAKKEASFSGYPRLCDGLQKPVQYEL